MGEPVTLHPPYTEADREAAFEAWRTAAGRSHARLARLTGLSRETVHTWATRYDWPRRARALDAEEAGGALLSAAAIIRRHLLGAVQVKGINLFEDCGSFRRQSELCGTSRAERKRQKKKSNNAGAAKRR